MRTNPWIDFRTVKHDTNDKRSIQIDFLNDTTGYDLATVLTRKTQAKMQIRALQKAPIWYPNAPGTAPWPGAGSFSSGER